MGNTAVTRQGLSGPFTLCALAVLKKEIVNGTTFLSFWGRIIILAEHYSHLGNLEGHPDAQATPRPIH